MFVRWFTSRIFAGVGCALALAVVMIPPASHPALQTDTGTAIISGPGLDAELSGMIQITGTAIDPFFVQYELAYAINPPSGDDAWQPIQPPIAQQVPDGVLGAWDTTTVGDGVYQIRLRVVSQDGALADDQVRVRVTNATPLPTPSNTALPSPTVLPPSATPGPSPTSVIWQPPTRTPRPSMTPGGPTRTPRPFAAADSPFTPARLGAAAGSGILIGFAVFIGLAVYLIMRRAVRGELRSGWQQVLTEYIHPLFNSIRRRGKRS